MKIGELSRQLNVSINAIRHYIDLELLVPERAGKLFEFDQQAVDDLRFITRLKDMGFTLREIQALTTVRRVSNWVEPEAIGEYMLTLRGKAREHEARIAEYHRYLQRIAAELESVESAIDPGQSPIGVPLHALEYLCCPHCKGPLAAGGVQMNSRYLYSGQLACEPCRYTLQVENGIVSAPTAEEPGTPDLAREKYRDIPSSILTMMQKSYSVLLQGLQDCPDSGIVLETDINEFFFLYTHFRKLGKRALYIVTDRFRDALLMYKQRIEYMRLDLDILYLADGSGDYPLKPRCVGVAVDYLSANFRQAAGLSPIAFSSLLAPEGRLLGCYYAPEGSPSPAFAFGRCRDDLAAGGMALQKTADIHCRTTAPAYGETRHAFWLYTAVPEAAGADTPP